MQQLSPRDESRDQAEPTLPSDSNGPNASTQADESDYAWSDRGPQLDSLSSDPIDIQQLREARGYYSSGSSDINKMHPYELYDMETLEQLAANDDGLAQLVLADKISIDDPVRADRLYLDAAVNGKTAALVNLASSRLVAVPGGTDWGFLPTTSTGEISDEYIDVLKFYVAAEDSGDVVASEILQSHIDALGIEITEMSLGRLCEAGRELADLIRTEQLVKWGESKKAKTPITSYETPGAVCAI
jgi:hypothetical protein